MLNIKLSLMVLVLLTVGLLLVADNEPEGKDGVSRDAKTQAAAPLVPGDKHQSKTPENAPKEQTAKILAQLTGRFAEMATAVKVNEKQAKKLLAIQTSRDKALAEWDRTRDKKFAAAETRIAKTKNAKRKARLKANLKHLKATGRDRLEAQYQKKALSVFTPPQRSEYCGPKLWSAILQEFVDVNMEESQKAKALNICKGLTRTATSDPATNRSLKVKARKMIADNVLTKEQKKLLARRKAPTKTVPSKNKRTRDN